MTRIHAGIVFLVILTVTDCRLRYLNIQRLDRTKVSDDKIRRGGTLIVIGCDTALVLVVPRLGSWLDCSELYYNFSAGNASFRVLAAFC